MTDVLVVGSANRDVAVETDAFPGPGETVLGSGVRTSMGGKGANQAVAAALAGASTAMIARIGDDDAGRDVRATLERYGVDTALVGTATDEPTGTAAITVAGGENSIVVVPGANATWPAHWPDRPAREALATAGVVLAQLEIPVPIAVAAAAMAGRFVLNASPAAALPAELLAHCAVLLVNEHELVTVLGTGVESGIRVFEISSAHEDLLRRGAGAVVTTLGPRGAVVTDDSGTIMLDSPAVDPAEAVDTTGAGDAFAGVLCAKLAAGLPLREAARWAVAAGSWAVRSPGTVESYADADRLAELVR